MRARIEQNGGEFDTDVVIALNRSVQHALSMFGIAEMRAATGEKQLEQETEAWRKLTVAVAQVLEGA